jgi:hypothetical protein
MTIGGPFRLLGLWLRHECQGGEQLVRSDELLVGRMQVAPPSDELSMLGRVQRRGIPQRHFVDLQNDIRSGYIAFQPIEKVLFLCSILLNNLAK